MSFCRRVVLPERVRVSIVAVGCGWSKWTALNNHRRRLRRRRGSEGGASNTVYSGRDAANARFVGGDDGVFSLKHELGRTNSNDRLARAALTFQNVRWGRVSFNVRRRFEEICSSCQLCFFSHQNSVLESSGLDDALPATRGVRVAGLREPPSFATAHILVSPEP